MKLNIMNNRKTLLLRLSECCGGLHERKGLTEYKLITIDYYFVGWQMAIMMMAIDLDKHVQLIVLKS